MSGFPIILKKGQLVLVAATPVAGVGLGNTTYKTGMVTYVSDIMETYKTGDKVLYDQTGATILSYSGTGYILVQEDKIIYKYS